MDGGYRDSFVASTGTEMGSSLGAVLHAFNRTYEANLRKQAGLPQASALFPNPIARACGGTVLRPHGGDLMQEAFVTQRLAMVHPFR